MRPGEEICSAGRALGTFVVICAVSIFLKAYCAEGVVAVEYNWIHKRDMADWAHQMRVIVRDIIEASQVYRGLRLQNGAVHDVVFGDFEAGGDVRFRIRRTRWRQSLASSGELCEERVYMGL